MKQLTRFILSAVLGLFCLATSVSAQTVLGSTTISAAQSDTSGQSITVASTTGITASTNGTALTYLLIDREFESVRSVNTTSGVVGVDRGMASSRAATHVSGATVWVIPAAAGTGQYASPILSYVPSGQCTRTNLSYVPVAVGYGVGGGGAASDVGTLWDCLGVGAAGQWVNVNGNSGLPVLGSTVASPAGVLTPTGTIFTVSGTNAVTGITVPAGAAPGFAVAWVPSGVCTFTAAGNIALAGSCVVNKLLVFTWNGTKWIPSYIA